LFVYSSLRIFVMDKKLIKLFRAQLLERRENLLVQIASLRGGAIGRVEASADHFGQPGDSRAQTVTARELEFALDERESAELAAVDAALLRIEGGVYGQCTDCGVDIPAPRLHASPEAARCIPCQNKAEQGHGKLASA
jgi:DnaK suppressor protein